MNRLAGFALIGGLLASSAAASGANASQVAHERSAYLAAPAVQQPLASAEQAFAGTGCPACAIQHDASDHPCVPSRNSHRSPSRRGRAGAGKPGFTQPLSTGPY